MDRETAEKLVEAIWARWNCDLEDWDLESSLANAPAKALAIEAIEQAHP